MHDLIFEYGKVYPRDHFKTVFVDKPCTAEQGLRLHTDRDNTADLRRRDNTAAAAAGADTGSDTPAAGADTAAAGADTGPHRPSDTVQSAAAFGIRRLDSDLSRL